MTAGTLSAPPRTAKRGLRGLLDQRFLVVLGASYLALRLFSFVVMSWVATIQDPAGVPNGPTGAEPGYFDMTRMWDGGWYQRIVEEGYPSTLPRDEAGVLQQNQWAFYPLFPIGTRALMELTGGSFGAVASTLALLLGLGAALIMSVLLRERVGPVAAFAGVIVLAASPPSPTLQMAYTESLALLLLCWFLLAAGRQQWWLAAGIALLTGLSRPIALPLGIVVLVALVVRWRERRTDPIDRREGAGLLAMLAACGAAGLIWPAIAWWRTGERDAYPATMGTWRSGEDIEPFRPMLENAQLYFGQLAGPLVVVAILVITAVAVLGPWADGLGPLLRAWTLAYLGYLVAVLDPGTSIYRYLLFAFPLGVIAVGGAWAHQTDRDLARRFLPLRTTVLVLLGLGWQVWWCFELLRVIPPIDNPI